MKFFKKSTRFLATRVTKEENTQDIKGNFRFIEKNEISIPQVQAAMLEFRNLGDKAQMIDAYRLCRTLVTYDHWNVPTDAPDIGDEVKIAAQRLDNGDQRIYMYSEKSIWKKDEFAAYLSTIGDITIPMDQTKVSEMILDPESDHELCLPRDFFPHFENWRNIVDSEIALNKIRTGSEIAQQYHSAGKELTDVQKDALFHEPLRQLKEFGEFMLVTRSVEENRVELLMAPLRSGKRFLAAFTAPDLITTFLKMNGLTTDAVRSLKWPEFIQYIKDIEKEIDGIHFNCDTQDQNLVHRESYFLKSFLLKLDEFDS